MNGSEDFKAGEDKGLILGKLEAIDEKLKTMQTSFERFGARMGTIEEQANIVRTKVEILAQALETVKKTVEENEETKKKIIWGILSSIALSIVGMFKWVTK